MSREIDVCQDDIALSEIYLSVSVSLSLGFPAVSQWLGNKSHVQQGELERESGKAVENRDEVKKSSEENLCVRIIEDCHVSLEWTHTHTQYQGGEEIECTTIR